MQGREIILASSSPRRHELLTHAGVSFTIQVSGCDETPVQGETARNMVERLALLKASEIADANKNALVIGADTTVVIDGESLGKPESEEHARQLLSKIQGRTHEVLGGVALVCHACGIEIVRSFSTQVTMCPMSEREIAWYVKTGEPMDKAGAYAIQGIGLQFVASIAGSYSNVVGLDIAEVMVMLRELGYSFLAE